MQQNMEVHYKIEVRLSSSDFKSLSRKAGLGTEEKGNTQVWIWFSDELIEFLERKGVIPLE